MKDANIYFVFGSNTAGKHGKGAALDALNHWGAVYGQGEGLQGHSYAIPTKNSALNTLPLKTVKEGVERFLKFARENEEKQFWLTRIGCGLAGYKDKQIAPLFDGYPANVIIPIEWEGKVKSGPAVVSYPLIGAQGSQHNESTNLVNPPRKG